MPALSQLIKVSRSRLAVVPASKVVGDRLALGLHVRHFGRTSPLNDCERLVVDLPSRGRLPPGGQFLAPVAQIPGRSPGGRACGRWKHRTRSESDFQKRVGGLFAGLAQEHDRSARKTHVCEASNVITRRTGLRFEPISQPRSVALLEPSECPKNFEHGTFGLNARASCAQSLKHRNQNFGGRYTRLIGPISPSAARSGCFEFSDEDIEGGGLSFGV